MEVKEVEEERIEAVPLDDHTENSFLLLSPKQSSILYNLNNCKTNDIHSNLLGRGYRMLVQPLLLYHIIQDNVGHHESVFVL